MIYLDNAATTKVDDIVINEMNNYHSKNYGNASSNHFHGVELKKKISQAKETISDLINCKKEEICFTSGATEAINMALKGYAESNINLGNHIVTTKVEHKAVLEVCKYLENIGFDVTYLDVDKNGLINIDELKNSIKTETILVSVLWVNNETGIIQDLKAISSIVKQSNAKLFIDATQAVGKMDVDLNKIHIDMLCFSGHKFHGPKGIGVLYIKDGIKLSPLIMGGGQEKGLRSGTINVPGIIGLSKACELIKLAQVDIKAISNYTESSLIEIFNCSIIGQKANRSNYILNVLFDNIDADVIISKLRNTVISTGSACNSEIQEPSHVLKNMAIGDDKAFSSLRFSFSRFTTIEEIDLALKELKKVINN